MDDNLLLKQLKYQDNNNLIELLRVYEVSWVIDGASLSVNAFCVSLDEDEIIFEPHGSINVAHGLVPSVKAQRIANANNADPRLLVFTYNDSKSGFFSVK